MAGAAICPAIFGVCRTRATRLDSTGLVADPPDNSYVSDSAVSVQISPNTEAGLDVTLKGGCDCIIASVSNPDLLKGYNLELTKGKFEPALEEMLLGGSIITSGGEDIGFFAPGPLDCGETQPAVAIEFWAQTRVGNRQSTAWPYIHFIFPHTTWQDGQSTLQNDLVTVPFTGKAQSNDGWVRGPYGDMPADMPADSPYGRWLEDETLPAAFCGFESVTPGS